MSNNALKTVVTGQAEKPAADMSPKELIEHHLAKRRGEIAKMLPKHLNAERMLKVAQIAATTTPALAECDVASLVGAIAQCAQMGLEPNTILGHAYLVPFNTKRKDRNGNEKWVKSVQVVIGYKGLVDLARRSGQIVSIAAHEVCQNDHFELVYGLEEKLVHKPVLGDRGDVIGFYAVAKLVGGGHAFEFMSRLQVEAIRDASQSAYRDEWVNGRKTGNRIPKDGPWWQHFVEMGRKTVIRRLGKYLPLSIEAQAAMSLDGAAADGKDQFLDTFDGEFTVRDNDDAALLGHETYDDDPMAMQIPPREAEPVAAASATKSPPAKAVKASPGPSPADPVIAALRAAKTQPAKPAAQTDDDPDDLSAQMRAADAELARQDAEREGATR